MHFVNAITLLTEVSNHIDYLASLGFASRVTCPENRANDYFGSCRASDDGAAACLGVWHYGLRFCDGFEMEIIFSLASLVELAGSYLLQKLANVHRMKSPKTAGRGGSGIPSPKHQEQS